MHNAFNSEIFEKSTAWPFQEAYKIVERLKNHPKKTNLHVYRHIQYFNNRLARQKIMRKDYIVFQFCWTVILLGSRHLLSQLAVAILSPNLDSFSL